MALEELVHAERRVEIHALAVPEGHLRAVVLRQQVVRVAAREDELQLFQHTRAGAAELAVAQRERERVMRRSVDAAKSPRASDQKRLAASTSPVAGVCTRTGSRAAPR